MGILTMEEALKREEIDEGRLAELNGKDYFCEKRVATIYTRIGADLDSYEPVYDFRSEE